MISERTRRFLLSVLAFALGYLATRALPWLYSRTVELAQESDVGCALLSIADLLLPVAVGAGLSAWVWRRQARRRTSTPHPALPRRWPRRRVAAVALVGMFYLLTWIFGVPAVQTHEDRWVVNQYKEVVAKGNKLVFPSHPWFKTRVAFAPLPGLVVSYSEYAITGLYGWGGWQVHIWWPGGLHRVFTATAWIS